MFPLSPYARPVGSFQVPVPPPPQSGAFCDTMVMEFDAAWLPYIIGALSQLTLQATWQGDDATVQDTQQRAAALIASIQHAVCKTAPQQGGLEGDECEMCCLRWNNGVLQMFSCGQWADVPGGGPINPGTPSSGQGQPAANGGSQSVCLELIANQTVTLGVNVSTGDTLLLSNLSGTWRDVTSLLGVINCPDGYIYVEGACVADFPSGSPDPVPTALHMGIIAYIDGVAYDVTGVGPFVKEPVLFTVPSGISNKPVFFQANIANLQNANGAVGFCVEVTNNAAGDWTQVFDFTLSAYPTIWEILNLSDYTPAQGVYTPGSGYQTAAVTEVANGHKRDLLRLVTHKLANYTSVKDEFSFTSGGYDGNTTDSTYELYYDSTVLNRIVMPTVPTSPQVWAGSVTPTSALGGEFDAGFDPSTPPGGIATLYRRTITGKGVNPFI